MTLGSGVVMRRRDFITLLGGATTWPFAAHSQPAGKLPIIGFLGAATPAAWNPWTSAFEKQLSELGWIEGRTIVIERRWAEGRPERYFEIAAELVRLKVDVIVTAGPAVPAVKQATTATPIVFALAPDPVGSGLVASLARPGGNATGLSLQQAGTSGKRLELLRQVVPGLRRLAIIFNAGNPENVTELDEMQGVARALGLEVMPLEISRAEDIEPAFAALKGGTNALYVVGDPMTRENAESIVTLALGARLAIRSSQPATLFKPGGSCHTDLTSRTYSDAPPRLLTRFCTARSPQIFRSSNRPNSISRSISPQQRCSVSKCRTTCSSSPTK